MAVVEEAIEDGGGDDRSPNTEPHSPTLRLLVIKMAPRSYRRLTSWKKSAASAPGADSLTRRYQRRFSFQQQLLLRVNRERLVRTDSAAAVTPVDGVFGSDTQPSLEELGRIGRDNAAQCEQGGGDAHDHRQGEARDRKRERHTHRDQGTAPRSAGPRPPPQHHNRLRTNCLRTIDLVS
jgi:hypothetical protein